MYFYSTKQGGSGIWHPIKTVSNEGMVETDTEICCDVRFQLPEGLNSNELNL